MNGEMEKKGGDKRDLSGEYAFGNILVCVTGNILFDEVCIRLT